MRERGTKMDKCGGEEERMKELRERKKHLKYD